jgi:hypothetical protein
MALKVGDGGRTAIVAEKMLHGRHGADIPALSLCREFILAL